MPISRWMDKEAVVHIHHGKNCVQLLPPPPSPHPFHSPNATVFKFCSKYSLETSLVRVQMIPFPVIKILFLVLSSQITVCHSCVETHFLLVFSETTPSYFKQTAWSFSVFLLFFAFLLLSCSLLFSSFLLLSFLFSSSFILLTPSPLPFWGVSQGFNLHPSLSSF